ncbi:innexin domain-containing protein [Ditylenchus destructor]|nr:innexin domain-containing protein [Ditylenchus destructor]
MSWGANNNFNNRDTKNDLIPGIKEVKRNGLVNRSESDRKSKSDGIAQETSDMRTNWKSLRDQETFNAYCALVWRTFISWVWKNHYRQSEGNPDLVMREARKMKNMNETERRAMLNTLASNMWDCLDTDAHENACRQTFWYISTKILFIVNIVVQFVLLGSFINRGYNAWCWNVFLSVLGLEDHSKIQRWTDAPVFPTDALCDIVVRQLGNSHRHTIQCMLTINQFNEKMFLFFSVYFLFVGIITVGNTISWIFALTLSTERYNMVRRLIKKEKLDEGENRSKLSDFVDNVLKTDGILLLHFIKSTAGAFVARDVCTQLFANYDPECLSTPFSVICTAPIDDWGNNYPKQSSRGFNSRLDNVDGKESKGYRSQVATNAPDTDFVNTGFDQTASQSNDGW